VAGFDAYDARQSPVGRIIRRVARVAFTRARIPGRGRSPAILFTSAAVPAGRGVTSNTVWDPWPDVDIHLEWGERGAAEAADRGDDVVVVDAFRFSTTVTMAVERGARVMPLGRGERAPEGTSDLLTLSPTSTEALPPGERFALWSANGAAVVAACRHAPRVTLGCFRNRAAAAAALRLDRRTTVVPCAERWSSIGSGHGIRPSIEDWLAAGAIVAATAAGSTSPEAAVAAAGFGAAGTDLDRWLRECISGREIVARQLDRDVEALIALDVSDVVPMLAGDGFFRAA
jgi:2-phosphosulfolactate phosphatase